MPYRRPVDLRTKDGRAVRAARIGIGLVRTASFWHLYDEETREEIERHFDEDAPEMKSMFEYARNCPAEARQRLASALTNRFNEVLHYAATRNPWFEAEVEELRREYLKYNMGLDPGAVSTHVGTA